MSTLERTLLWTIRAGFVLLLLTPFIVSRSFFFPFITGKNFYFRIIVELMLGAWGALALLNPAFRPRVSPLFAAIAAFVAALTLATALGVHPYRSFWSNFERMEGLVTQLHFLALFLVLAHSVKTRREWGIFLIISLVLSMHPALHGLLQYADSTNDILQKSKTLQGLGFDPIIGASRPYARFGNSIYLAVYLMFHLFFLAVVFAGSKLPWARILVGAAFLFELFVFFQAASRGAFLGFIVGVGLAGILAAIFSRSRAYRIAGFSAVGLVVALALLLLFAPYNFLIQRSELLGRFSSAIHSGIGDDPRIMIWGIAVDAFKARPLFGWGPENFTIPYAKFYNPNLFGNEPWFDRAHNIFLEWLVAGGIIGFVAYIAIFVCALWMLARVARVRIQARFEIILMAGLVVAYMVQNVFVFDNVMTYVMAAALFAYIHSYAISADNSVSKRYVPRATNFALAALSVVASLVLAYALNAKPIRAAGGIIAGMESFKTADTNVIKKAFDDTIQLNTFGTTEARERIADTMVQIATNIDSTNEAYKMLLDYSIEELERERKESPNPRIPLFLGKLYTIRTNLTGKDAELAEDTFLSLQQNAPNYIQTYLGLAELYMIAGDFKKALSVASRAYELPQKVETKGALFVPVFSVHMIAGAFDEALAMTTAYKARYNSWPPVLDKVEVEIFVQRARRGGAVESRLRLFEELNKIFFDNYGYPQAVLLQETIDLYRSVGNTARPRELLAAYARPYMKEKARVVAQQERNERNAAVVDRFLQHLDELK